MNGEVQPSDIEDLRQEDRTIHARITRQSDQNREDFQRLYDGMDKMKDNLSAFGKPLGEMAGQVKLNTQSTADLKAIYIKSIDELKENIKTIESQYIKKEIVTENYMKKEELTKNYVSKEDFKDFKGKMWKIIGWCVSGGSGSGAVIGYFIGG